MSAEPARVDRPPDARLFDPSRLQKNDTAADSRDYRPRLMRP